MNRIVYLLFFSFLFFSSCKQDPQLPDNKLQFEVTEQGFDATQSEIAINLVSSQAVEKDISVQVDFASTNALYNEKFTIEPAAQGNKVLVTLAKGASKTSFKLKKVTGVLFEGNETVQFTISLVDAALVLGEKKTIKVSFSEIVSKGTTMDPAVGGATEPNKVFIDLSTNRQSSSIRNSWDLAFYTVSGQFRVVINSATSMLVKQLNKNNVTEVTDQDTLGMGKQLTSEAIFKAITSNPLPNWIGESVHWIDDPSGDMSKTAISEVSSVEANNKVYIVNRGKNPDGTQRGWKKFRVIRKDNDYVLQHAEIASATFQSVTITRNESYLFNYVNFNSGVLDIEPAKDKWDIAFSVFTNLAPVNATTMVPYAYSDFVLLNRYQTKAAEVKVSTITYENFAESNLPTITGSASQIAIGSTWRTSGGPTSTPTLKSDSFYVIWDSSGNIYKLRFVALTQNGERGRPKIEYALVKKG